MIRMAEPAYKITERVIPAKLDEFSGTLFFWLQHDPAEKCLGQTAESIGAYRRHLYGCHAGTDLYLVAIRRSVHYQSATGTARTNHFPGSDPSPDLTDATCHHDEKKNHSVEYQQLWHDSKYNRGPLVSLIVLRIILCIGLVMLPIARLLNTAVGIGLAIAATVIALVIFSKRLKKQSILMERHFFTNLTARELENGTKRSHQPTVRQPPAGTRPSPG